MAQMRTYSGSAVSCALAGDLFPPVQFGGINQTGLRSLTIRPTVDHAVIDGGMDGAPAPSWKPGEWGEIDVEVWQTSFTHQQLLNAYNANLAAANAGDVSSTFTSVLIVNEIGGQTTTCTGVGFPKRPDKPYQDQAQAVHWVFRSCNIVEE